MHFLNEALFLTKADTLHADIDGLCQDCINLSATDAEPDACYRCEDQNISYPIRNRMFHQGPPFQSYSKDKKLYAILTCIKCKVTLNSV